MRRATLIARSLAGYWRTNAAVVAGVAVAAAVLAGALLLGASVRASLRAIALSRLGAAEAVLSGAAPFRASLKDAFPGSAALLAWEASARLERTGAAAHSVLLYGVDDSFFAFHGQGGAAPPPRTGRMSPALARELSGRPGDSLLLKFDSASAIPREFLHGRKEAPARTLRVTLRNPVEQTPLGDFSLRAQQGGVRAVFVPLAALQRALGREGEVNTLLLKDAAAGQAAGLLRANVTLADLGLRAIPLAEGRGLSFEHASTLLPPAAARAIQEAAAGLPVSSYFTYLANSLTSGSRSIPYSTVTAADRPALERLAGGALPGAPDPVLLNEWAARELQAAAGGSVAMDFLVWGPDGALRHTSARFTVAAVVPMKGAALDRDVVPAYPGITDAPTLAGWDPPFPLDLSRVRPADEAYWKQYRATPKAWIPLEAGQRLWGSRFGDLTSMRVAGAPDGLAGRVRAGLDPLAAAFQLIPVRAVAETVSAGATDFGGYFAAFSFFLVVSALLLAGLFFRLGVEQRLAEIGLLRAVGFSQKDLRRLFLLEGAVLALAGVALGALLSAAYTSFLLYALRTFWVDAVGTRLLTLSADPASLAAGASGALGAAMGAVFLTLRGLRDFSPRALLAGAAPPAQARPRVWPAVAAALLGGALLLLTLLQRLPREAAFFGAGACFLASGLLALHSALRGAPGASHAPRTLRALAWRNAGWRPGRSVLTAVLIASAAFLLVALESFRRDPARASAGAGGYGLAAEAQVPIIQREDLDLPQAPAARWVPFRLRPGDDVSCLNLYQPRNPRILGVPRAFRQANRVPFGASLARTEAEKANPWLLLDSGDDAGAVPAAADLNSLTYILHRKVGDTLEIPREGAPPLRVKIVAALADSIFQSELLIAEERFLRLFPEHEGFRVFLIDAPPSAAAALEDSLSDFGFDAQSAAEKLASYHRVEGAYLSAFQLLGGLGLLLGALGLGAVLARNALERRRELALLRSLGFTRPETQRLLLLESAALLACGLLTGTMAALAAVAPALIERGIPPSLSRLLAVLAVVALAGLGSSWLAGRAASKIASPR